MNTVGSAGVNIAVINLEFDAQRLKAEDVHVDLSGTDVAAARHGNDRAPETRKKRAHHSSGGPHLNDEVVGGLPRIDVSGIDF